VIRCREFLTMLGGAAIGDHLAKRGPAALLGGLHVHISLRHHEPVGGRVFLEELQLRRD